MKRFLNNKAFDQGVGGGRFGFSNVLVLGFLVFNLVIRFSTIFNYPPYNGYIAAFFGVIISCCMFMILFPRYLKAFLFLFGFSFFLFGFGSIDVQSRVFELIVTCVATTLFVINWRAKETYQLNRPLVILIVCYVVLSLFSLLLLPVRLILKDLWFFGFPDAFFYLFIGPPYGFYYPVVAVIRLMLFVVLAIQLSTAMRCQDNYKWLFGGIFSSAVFCSIIGLLDYYRIISLARYRFGVTAGVLQSTFLNRGWFAEFILSVVPFVLIGFMSKIKGAWWKILLLGSLVICEIALILSGGRAGWVSYPVVLFICWVFFWFSKEGRFESFHFRWRDLVKIAVSVPITIAISLVLIFFVLMPLSDYLKNEGGGKGIQKGSKATKAYIVSQTARLVEPRGRIRAWMQGVDVGRESPVLGLGYESFSWHANILSATPNSYYTIYKNNKHSRVLQTPHNIFVQIFVSGGIVGLCLWLLIVGYAVVILTFDLIRNKRLLNTPVIISIISFHIFGIFQSMQYIPMIWAMIFLCLGYAMTIDVGVLPDRLRRVFGVLTKVSVVLVVIGFFVYLNNFESRSLAEKYGLNIYAMDQDRDRFGGFYQESKRWKYGDYRWCGKRGSVAMRRAQSGERGAQGEKDEHRTSNIERPTSNGGEGEDSGRRVVEFEFYCRTPGVEKEPVVLTVFHDGKLIDEISFRKEGSVRKKYEVPEIAGEEKELVLEISRTWVPHDVLGNFDRRELGVGVRIVKTED